MNLPEYDVKPGAEAAWAGVSTAVGTLVGAILVALDVDANIVAAAATLSGALSRIVIGHFLPSSE